MLSADDLAFWDEHGYVVLHDAVPAATLAAAAQALWDHLGARADDPESWYRRRDHGIMVQYFQHPAFEAIRRSARIHKAFAQLWGHADLWATTDRVGFNVPERPGFMFPGPDLHWDCSVKTPIPFGTQGILYLTDTPPEQGAFTLVPGFQRWGEDWLKGLPPGADPRRQDLHALGSDSHWRARRRSHHLAPGAAARRQPQPRDEAAAGAVPRHVSGADGFPGRVDLRGALSGAARRRAADDRTMSDRSAKRPRW